MISTVSNKAENSAYAFTNPHSPWNLQSNSVESHAPRFNAISHPGERTAFKPATNRLNERCMPF